MNYFIFLLCNLHQIYIFYLKQKVTTCYSGGKMYSYETHGAKDTTRPNISLASFLGL